MQFLSTNTNLRTDRYGGSTLNRCRFVVEVLEAMADAIGPGRVGLRINPGGPYNDMADADPADTYGTLLRLLNPLRLAYCHLIYRPKPDFDALDLVNTHWSGPVIGNDELTAERARAPLQSGRVRAVSFGRPYISNPDLVERFRRNAPRVVLRRRRRRLHRLPSARMTTEVERRLSALETEAARLRDRFEFQQLIASYGPLVDTADRMEGATRLSSRACSSRKKPSTTASSSGCRSVRSTPSPTRIRICRCTWRRPIPIRWRRPVTVASALALGFGGREEVARKNEIYRKAWAERKPEDQVGYRPPQHLAALCPTMVMRDRQKARRIGLRGQRFFGEVLAHWYQRMPKPTAYDLSAEEHLEVLHQVRYQKFAKLGEDKIAYNPANFGYFEEVHDAYGNARGLDQVRAAPVRCRRLRDPVPVADGRRAARGDHGDDRVDRHRGHPAFPQPSRKEKGCCLKGSA